MNVKQKGKPDAGVSDADRFSKIKSIMAKVSNWDPEKWTDVFKQLNNRAEKVDVRAVNAISDSIIIDDQKFSGLLQFNLTLTFQDGGDVFESSDYVIGWFEGNFPKGKTVDPEITDIKIVHAQPKSGE